MNFINYTPIPVKEQSRQPNFTELCWLSVQKKVIPKILPDSQMVPPGNARKGRPYYPNLSNFLRGY